MKLKILICCVVAVLSPAALESSSTHHEEDRRRSRVEAESRMGQLVEANIMAIHAYQVGLTKKSGRGDSGCFSGHSLSDQELAALVSHQNSLLASNPKSVVTWVKGHPSSFDPLKDLLPILSSKLRIPEMAPVNIFTEYLRKNTKSSTIGIRAVANLYQTVLEVERDGDVLQQEFDLYIALGLPVYAGQIGLPGSDGDFLEIGKELAGQVCLSPFDTDTAAWQIAGRKIWNWGEKKLHIRDEKVLASELLREPEIRELVPRMQAQPSQKVAIIGHSFTMGAHWSSPSSFVPIVTSMFAGINPRVEFRQFQSGGLTASRALREFYADALAWKPDKVLLVVLARKDEDYDALRQMGEGFTKSGVQCLVFDNLHDPEAQDPAKSARFIQVAEAAGMGIIPVDVVLSHAPDRDRFLCLDRIHMTESYHRLMAKEWLRFLVRDKGMETERQVTRAPAPLKVVDPLRPVHPRLLIGEQDSFTGLSLLRSRLASSLRPPEDMVGWALSYLITHEESYAQKALGEMQRTHLPKRATSGNYLEWIKWSLAFDWLYNSPGFESTLKDHIAQELVDGAEEILNRPTLVYPSQVSYQNYSVRDLALATFALVAVEGHPSVESRTAPKRNLLRKAFDNVLDTSQLVTPDGGYHESMDYLRHTMVPLVLLSELRRTTTGEDPARRFTVFQNLSMTYLFNVLPDGTTARDDDNEYPFLLEADNTILGYAVNRFKDPFAAWILRESGWLPKKWSLPVLEFLWSDPLVAPRSPAQTTCLELPHQRLFRGIGHLVMRTGWNPEDTWIEFNSGPYFAKHDHLDQNHFVIYHKGYLAIDSGADYTDTESPHYLNYYRRTIAHKSMLVYKPGESFFWGENLFPAANDGGQRMDSSRYWNTIRSREDWQRTRDLWETGRMEAVDDVPGLYTYARGDATRAYHPTKVSLFTRELVYLIDSNVLVVFDRVHSTQPEYKKAWLLHGVNEPEIEEASQSTGQDIGHGGTAFSDARSFIFREGQGQLRVHCLLPREHEVVKRGGTGWEYWTPGDASNGAWGSGQNWPLIPFAGGLLPEDVTLRKMWSTFWGQEMSRILPSNSKNVVPGAWRIEVSPRFPAREDSFLHVLEIQDTTQKESLQVEVVDGHNLVGAKIGDLMMVLFAKDSSPVTEAEVSVPDGTVESALFARMQPNARYELQFTDLGATRGRSYAEANEAGVMRFSLHGYSGARLRVKRIQ